MAAVMKKNERSRSGADSVANKEAQVSLIEEVVSVRRVAKVIKGGRRLVFSAFVVVGDGAGRVGLGSGKGREVAPAVSKAFKRARKNLVTIPMSDSTIPFEVEAKFGASKVLIRPASKGTGVIAGGATRLIMSALGIKDVLSKSLGSSNPINVSHAVMNALAKLKALAVMKKTRNFLVNNAVASIN